MGRLANNTRWTVIRVLLTVLALAFTASSATAADWPPTDHGGSDVVSADGDIIWGLHTGIGTFRITSGSALSVRPYDGQDNATGMLEVYAQRIEIDGVLDATGAGFTGGGGGGGGGGCIQPCFGIVVMGGYPGGGPGLAQYSCAADTASSGGSAYVYNAGISTWGCSPGSGGSAGGGDGPFGGIPGVYDTVHRGGYAAPETNGDTSMDRSTLMGSGCGGVAGTGAFCSATGVGGPGGSGGGCGGGTIRLFPSQGFRMSAWCAILANGSLGEMGKPSGMSGDLGGDSLRATSSADPSLSAPGTGGAGGGVLLDLASVNNLVVETGATIFSLGGGDEPANGGTVKIFWPMTGSQAENPSILAGRSFISNPALVQEWELYQ